MTPPRPLWSSTTVISPHGSSKSTESSSPSRRRLKKRASERSSKIWRQRPSGGTIQGGSRPALAATIMTEDAKTEENTAGGPCGVYIEMPCKLKAQRMVAGPCIKVCHSGFVRIRVCLKNAYRAFGWLEICGCTGTKDT